MHFTIKQHIFEIFADPDLSMIKRLLYFKHWRNSEQCKGYLIFVGIDDTIQQCQYGHHVSDEDKTQYFRPVQIEHAQYLERVKEIDEECARLDALEQVNNRF